MAAATAADLPTRDLPAYVLGSPGLGWRASVPARWRRGRVFSACLPLFFVISVHPRFEEMPFEEIMSTLVIVESPAKAKTIAGYLGSGFEVLASFGHVRDLPERADDIPADMKKQKWAKLGVNVEGGFEPLYIVPEDKKRHVASLRAAMKGATSLLLATDEDREGESISWHILQVLHPPKSVKVGRIVFHEITPEAIREALQSPRQVDESLVRAQETRRILDRLFGYTLSPLLWKKVAPRLSAGRVQSVAVRLLVERERQRAAFKSATWWDLEAALRTGEGAFKARLQSVDGRRLATGKSFDSNTGELSDREVVLFGEAGASALADASRAAKPWRVAGLETREETEAAAQKLDIAITPLAIPMLSGPGAISTVILLHNKADGIAQNIALCA